MKDQEDISLLYKKDCSIYCVQKVLNMKEINDCLTNLKDLNTDKPDTLDKPNSTRERATMIKSKIFQPSRK